MTSDDHTEDQDHIMITGDQEEKEKVEGAQIKRSRGRPQKQMVITKKDESEEESSVIIVQEEELTDINENGITNYNNKMKRKLAVAVKDEGEDEEEPRKCSGFRHSGSRRKSKPHRAPHSHATLYIYSSS